MNKIKKHILTLLVMSAMLLSAAGAVSVSAADLVAKGRPDPEGTPTRVLIGVYLTDLSGVDSVQQSFTPTFIIMVRWQDPRLASVDAEEKGFLRKIPLEDVWNPEILILNQKRLFKFFNPDDMVTVTPDGSVSYVVEYFGELVLPMNLRDFPFDRYVLPITLVSGKYGPEDLEFVIDVERIGRNDTFSIASWDIGELEGEVDSYYLESQDRDLARVDFRLPAQRYSLYYVSRIIIPLIFIVIMSFSVFWIDPRELGPQLGVATTSILTLIAFQFAINSSLPRIFYLTRMDLFILGATLIVFVAFLEAVTTSVLAKQDKEDLALAIDRKARLFFPLTMVLLIIYAFFVY